MTDQQQYSRTEEFWNNVFEQYNARLAEFDPFTLKEKSFFDVLVSGLEKYNSLPHAASSSIYLFDQEEADFRHKLSLPWELEQDEKQKFEILRDSGMIAETLASGEILVRKLSSCNCNVIIIPLFCYNGIQGLVVVNIGDEAALPEKILRVLKIFTNQFSLIIQSMLDQRELNNLNENIEQVVALKMLDITQSTRDVRYLLDSVQTGILIIDKSRGVISDANILAAEILGTTKDRLIGKSSHEFFFRSGKKQHGEIITNQEMLLKKNNDQYIPIIRTVAEVKLEEHEFYLISFMDITQRKKMELELQKAREELEQRVQERTADLLKLNTELTAEVERRNKAEDDLLKFYWAVQQNPVMITLTDSEGYIEYVNPRFTEVTGYTFNEVIGKNIRILSSGDDSFDAQKTFKASINSGQIWSGEHSNRKKNGELFWVASLISPIQNLDGEITHFVAVQEDVTIKKEAEKQIIIAKEKAEASDRLKSNIFANMSHELRTPLISILGFAEILLDELTEEMLSNMVRKIHVSGERLLRTLNTMLLMSQLEHNQVEGIYSSLDMCEVLHSMISGFTNSAQKKGLAFNVLGDDTPLPILATKEMLSSALYAVLDNAVKFTHSGGIKVIMEKLFAEDGSGIVRIRVSDTGIGIPEAVLPYIYDPFRQNSEGFGRSFEGAGLGLTIARKIVNLLRGTISVSSVVNQGSTFTLEFPLYRPS